MRYILDPSVAFKWVVPELHTELTAEPEVR
jgi:hypothetical protein